MWSCIKISNEQTKKFTSFSQLESFLLCISIKYFYSTPLHLCTINFQKLLICYMNCYVNIDQRKIVKITKLLLFCIHCEISSTEQWEKGIFLCCKIWKHMMKALAFIKVALNMPIIIICRNSYALLPIELMINHSDFPSRWFSFFSLFASLSLMFFSNLQKHLNYERSYTTSFLLQPYIRSCAFLFILIPHFTLLQFTNLRCFFQPSFCWL